MRTIALGFSLAASMACHATGPPELCHQVGCAEFGLRIVIDVGELVGAESLSFAIETEHGVDEVACTLGPNGGVCSPSEISRELANGGEIVGVSLTADHTAVIGIQVATEVASGELIFSGPHQARICVDDSQLRRCTMTLSPEYSGWREPDCQTCETAVADCIARPPSPQIDCVAGGAR